MGRYYYHSSVITTSVNIYPTRKHMKTNILVFTNEVIDLEATLAEDEVSHYEYVYVSEALIKSLAAKTSPRDGFVTACGGIPTFMALSRMWHRYKPRCIITVHADVNYWPRIFGHLPYSIRRRWIHFADSADFDVNEVASSVLVGNGTTDNAISRVLATHTTEGNAVIATTSSTTTTIDNPLISVFTSTFHSGATKLARAYESLLSQSYSNWEWVIVDDSKDDSQTELLEQIAMNDMRVMVHNFGHSGFIGQSKSRAAALCSNNSKWLVELDHDDRLMPHLLQNIVDIGRSNPAVGAIYSNFCSAICTTINSADGTADEDDLLLPKKQIEQFRYYPCAATSMGLGGQTAVFLRGQWHASYLSSGMNDATMRDIASCPNHVRVIRRDVYHAIGGYNGDLQVADDYDLWMRVYLHGVLCAHIDAPSYIQYEGEFDENFTKVRLPAIRHLQDVVRNTYAGARQLRYEIDHGLHVRNEGSDDSDDDERSQIVPLSLATLSDVTIAPPAAVLLAGEKFEMGRPVYDGDDKDRDMPCWMRPDVNCGRREVVWQNGRLHASHYDEATRFDVAHAMRRRHKHSDATPGAKRDDLPRLVDTGDLSLVLLVPEMTSLDALVAYLSAVQPADCTQVMATPIHIVAHPDSVVRALQLGYGNHHDALVKLRGIEHIRKCQTLLAHFTPWSFSMQDRDMSTLDYMSWQNEAPDISIRYMANYALKMRVRSSHVIYVNASMPANARLTRLLALVKTAVALPVDDPEVGTAVLARQPVYTFGRVIDDERTNGPHAPFSAQLHGFYHHSHVPELFGYWRLTDDTSVGDHCKMWIARSKM